MANIEMKQVSKAYRDHDCVIRDVDLRIAEGEFCVFVGPSGCGKSTLLRMIAGLETITEGELLIDGVMMNDVPPASRGVAMVFQSYALFPHMTVFDNLAFGMRIAGVRRDEIRCRVAKVAASLELDALLARRPKSLSGGQRQRVAIGRALVREPGVFLFDEPLSNLDAGLRAQTRLEIAKIHRDFGRASTVYVTHDQVEAMTLADRIVLLNSGEAVAREGSIAQAGAPLELYHRPRNLFVARFIGSPQMNLLPAVVIDGGAQTRVRLASGETLTAAVDGRMLSPGATVTVGIRAEDIGLGGAGQTLVRTVEWQERLGDTTYLYLAGYGDAPLVVRAPGRAHARRTQRIALQLPPSALHLFDQDGVALPREAPVQNGLIADPGKP